METYESNLMSANFLLQLAFSIKPVSFWHLLRQGLHVIYMLSLLIAFLAGNKLICETLVATNCTDLHLNIFSGFERVIVQ